MVISFQRSYFARLGFKNPILNAFPHSLFSPQVLPSLSFEESKRIHKSLIPISSTEENLSRKAKKAGREDNSEYNAFILSNLG